MEALFARLDSTRSDLLQLAGSLDDNSFRRKPSDDCWSVAEIITHLCLVERAVLSGLARAQKTHPKEPGLLAHYTPIAAAAFRTFKIKSPDFVVPKNVPPRDELMEMFASTRNNLKSFASEVSKQGLRKLPIKHPVFGDIDGWGAVKFILNHERRHLKQVREVLKQL